ncbi:MAG: nucleoside deaminase [Acidobacteria bacterium]|nr:nucleoside deaminase [Acidobacteriota bacterium]
MIFVNQPCFTLHLPDWLEKRIRQEKPSFLKLEDRMNFVIELSRLNVRHGMGGPFAAAVFRSDDGSILAPGVNMVLAAHCSVLHAEIVAIMAAQAATATHDLSSPELPSCELVTSTEPCAMCLGAVTWSGIRRLVCGARGEDAEEMGFDEGEKPPEWPEALERRRITVVRDICRDPAAAVLREYRAAGGLIYNPHRGFSRQP